jgi:hypothetical protein
MLDYCQRHGIVPHHLLTKSKKNLPNPFKGFAGRTNAYKVACGKEVSHGIQLKLKEFFENEVIEKTENP